MVDVIRQHIELADSPSGPEARIAGSRIRVMDVAIWHKMGMSADEIVSEFPTIALADVYAALAFYWDNREVIEREIEADRAYADEMRRCVASPLLEKLNRRRESPI
jgi:uncharacterized protein (DUF433 family)